MSNDTGATALPEWVELDFDDWRVIYHGGRLVGVGHPDSAQNEVSDYLGSDRYLANPALGTGGRGHLELLDNEAAAAKYGNGNPPETFSLDEYRVLRAASIG